MSKVKSPDEKKRLSLARDRRNAYGESPHASRKTIPRARQRSHQVERAAVRGALAGAGPAQGDEAALETVGAEVAQRARQKRLRAWRKKPDQPLADALLGKAWRGRLRDGQDPLAATAYWSGCMTPAERERRLRRAEAWTRRGSEPAAPAPEDQSDKPA